MSVWKCADCFHANQSDDDDARCYWCNSMARVAIYPVKVANQMQNTPDDVELQRVIAGEEAARHSIRSVEQQIEELIERYFAERDRLREPHRQGQSAEESDDE